MGKQHYKPADFYKWEYEAEQAYLRVEEDYRKERERVRKVCERKKGDMANAYREELRKALRKLQDKVNVEGRGRYGLGNGFPNKPSGDIDWTLYFTEDPKAAIEHLNMPEGIYYTCERTGKLVKDIVSRRHWYLSINVSPSNFPHHWSSEAGLRPVTPPCLSIRIGKPFDNKHCYVRKIGPTWNMTPEEMVDAAAKVINKYFERTGLCRNTKDRAKGE